MKKLPIIFSLFFITTSIIAQPLPPDTLWTKTLGAGYDHEGWWIEQTTDGGFIITGREYSGSQYEGLVCLIKLDVDGNTVWYSTFGGEENDVGRCVRQAEDGGVHCCWLYRVF